MGVRASAAAILALAVVTATCSGQDPERADIDVPVPTVSQSDETATPVAAADVMPVPADGAQLAAVDGVGVVHAGSTSLTSADVVVADAGDVPTVDGLLAAGLGLAVDTDPAPVGVVQIRLEVPAPPSEEAVPVVVHRRDDATVAVEPAIWDPAASQMVVWTAEFSDRWGAWYDPRNWVEEIVQLGQGTGDWIADFITGRTDPPACGAAPDWASFTTSELSSVHVCLHTNPDGDGTDRAEVYLLSNRRTAQMVTIPAGTSYVWTDNLPDDFRRLGTALAGASPSSNVLLLGGHAMSVGFTQPPNDETVDLLAFQSYRLIVVNPVLALLGGLPMEGTLASLAAAARCHAELSGMDLTRLDPIPDHDQPSIDTVEDLVRCAFEVLQDADLAAGVISEVAEAVGAGGAVGGVTGAAQALAPTAERIGRALAVASTLTNAWDGILDNLADGTLTLSLAGQTPADPGLPALSAGALVELFVAAVLHGDDPTLYGTEEAAAAADRLGLVSLAVAAGVELQVLVEGCATANSGDIPITTCTAAVEDPGRGETVELLQVTISPTADIVEPDLYEGGDAQLKVIDLATSGVGDSTGEPLRFSVAGLGPIAGGATVTSAEQRSGITLGALELGETDWREGFTWREYGCALATPNEPPLAAASDGYRLTTGIVVMIFDPAHQPFDGITAPYVARVSTADPSIRTRSGLGVGSTVAEIEAALGTARLTSAPTEGDPYPEWQWLDFSPADPSEQFLLLRFTVHNGTVVSMTGGLRQAVTLVEGCV